MVRAKYQGVLDLGEKLKIQNGDVSETDGILTVKGTANTPYDKNLLWDAIKAAGGDSPSDIVADIAVADTSVFARHTVKSGETLGTIAKQYYGSAGKYNAIFEANTNVLKSADVIHPDQELTIPNI